MTVENTEVSCVRYGASIATIAGSAPPGAADVTGDTKVAVLATTRRPRVCETSNAIRE